MTTALATLTGDLAHCQNGDCRRPIYRTHVCFRCWAGVKWTSIRQRVENKNGNNPSYEGVPLLFTKETLIQWVLDNPPPIDLVEPSIDRIVDAIGYAPGNLQWIEKRLNSRGPRKNIPLNHQYCALCKSIKPRNAEHFTVNRSKPSGLSNYCRPCENSYNRERARKKRDCHV